MNYPKLCFLIEDDPDDQEIFALALKEVSSDIHCMITNDGKQGIEELKSLKGTIPEFIFIDLNMPRMNGMECLAEIRKTEILNTCKVIIYSTTSDSKIIDTAFKNGANNFLVKPSSVSMLISSLGELFKK